uniref:Uncharacterized protein n=1 Tax=Arundo donax TaxID=35708 RepID=A0A0A9FC22_ARUDO
MHVHLQLMPRPLGLLNHKFTIHSINPLHLPARQSSTRLYALQSPNVPSVNKVSSTVNPVTRSNQDFSPRNFRSDFEFENC